MFIFRRVRLEEFLYIEAKYAVSSGRGSSLSIRRPAVSEWIKGTFISTEHRDAISRWVARLYWLLFTVCLDPRPLWRGLAISARQLVVKEHWSTCTEMNWFIGGVFVYGRMLSSNVALTCLDDVFNWVRCGRFKFWVFRISGLIEDVVLLSASGGFKSSEVESQVGLGYVLADLSYQDEWPQCESRRNRRRGLSSLSGRHWTLNRVRR